MQQYFNCLLFIAVLAFSPGTVKSQVRIVGVITDSVRHPLTFANVQAFDPAKKMVSYAIANDKGEYSLILTKAGDYLLKASCLGSFPQEKKIVVETGQALTVDFVLTSNPALLKEVVVWRDVAAKVRSDTVTYTVGKYLTGEEKVLKDVLNKLPGIEVKEDGKVKAYGKDVDKIMVEGDDFFFDQQKMATENLSADAVDQVQVLNNYQANALQKDFSQGGQTALNINIKDEYRNKLSGNIAAGGGYKEKFSGNATLYRFGKKLKSSLIAGTNNTGEETFSMHDYMSFSGGIQQLMENNDNAGGMVQINPSDLSSGIGGGNDANLKTTRLGALNANYKPNTKLKVNGNVVLSATNRSEFENVYRSFPGGNIIPWRTRLFASRELFLGNLNMGLNYKPRTDMSINYRMNAGANNVESKNDIENSGSRNYFMNEQLNLHTLKISQYLDYTWRISARSLINIGAFHEFTNKLLSEDLNSDSVFLGLEFQHSPYTLQQEVTSPRQQYGVSGSFAYKYGKVILKNISGVTWLQQPFTSKVKQRENDARFEYDDFANDLSYNILDYRTGFYLAKNKGLVQFNLGPSLHYYKSETNTGGNFNKITISPDLRFSLKFTEMHSLNFSFSERLVLPSPEDLLQNRYIKNYRTIVAGGLNPENYSTYNQLNGHYMIFDAFSNTMFSISCFYMKKADPVSVKSGPSLEYNTQQPVQVPFEESYGGMIYLDKKLRKAPFSIRFNSNYNRSYGYNYIQDRLNGITRQSVNGSSSILTRFNFPFNFEAGTAGSFINMKSSVVTGKNNFSSFQPFAKLLIYHKAGLSGFVSFSELKYKSETQRKNYRVLSSTIRYNVPKTSLELSISVSNLLNIDNYYGIDAQINDNYYQERQYSILPGYAIFKIMYTLKGVSK